MRLATDRSDHTTRISEHKSSIGLSRFFAARLFAAVISNIPQWIDDSSPANAEYDDHAAQVGEGLSGRGHHRGDRVVANVAVGIGAGDADCAIRSGEGPAAVEALPRRPAPNPIVP